MTWGGPERQNKSGSKIIIKDFKQKASQQCCEHGFRSGFHGCMDLSLISTISLMLLGDIGYPMLHWNELKTSMFLFSIDSFEFSFCSMLMAYQLFLMDHRENLSLSTEISI